jgi:dolichol kinase
MLRGSWDKEAVINKVIPTRSQTLRRALIHVLVGSVCALVIFVLPHLWTVILMTAATALVLMLDVIRSHAASPRNIISDVFSPFLRASESKTLSGASYLFIGSWAVALLFPRYIAVSAILFVSWGDPLAAIFSSLKGKIRVWGKFIEGDIACLVTCLVLAVVLAQFTGFPPLTVLIIGAAVASLFQTLPAWINDNISIPLASAVAMTIAAAFLH